MIWPFARKRKISPAPGQGQEPPRTMADFFAKAQVEIDQLIAQAPGWFESLPYQGAMSRDAARRFEIEKRAVWRRVIYDAGRGDLKALVWTTRQDGLVCDLCRQMEGRCFEKHLLDELAGLPVHLGCRCELVPVRS